MSRPAADAPRPLEDDGSRYRAPLRIAPQCSVFACDRDSYAILEGTDNVMLCAEHWHRFYLVTLKFLGDAHAEEKWKAVVSVLGAEVGWGAGGVLGVGPGTLPATVISAPSEWRCASCGLGLAQGPRGHWSHRCKG